VVNEFNCVERRSKLTSEIMFVKLHVSSRADVARAVERADNAAHLA
jgi:hypothetical protein